jgi:DNA-binding PadR family transcriptional regulator
MMSHKWHFRGHRHGARFEAFARAMAEQMEGGGWTMGHGRGAGGRGGGFRRRVFDQGELRLVLLSLIAEQPRHGYDLIKAIEERSGGTYAPSAGVVYPTLTLLADMGLVSEQADGTRKTFAITADGEAELAREAEATEAAMARLDELAKLSARTDAAPIRRAMRSLHSALHARLGEDADRELQLAIAAILDEATSKVERL